MSPKKIAAVADDRPPPRKPSARSSAKARQTAARLTAVQIVYQAELTGRDLRETLIEFNDYRIGQIIDELELIPAEGQALAEIIAILAERAGDIDELLGRTLVGTSLARLEKLLRAIVRTATAELIGRLEIPVGVIIGDYLSVTQGFFGQTEIRLINAALDATAKAARPQ